ncbi:MAG: hypothetical protein ACAH09_09735, partial [Methylophilaceae bacterium]
AFSRTLLDSRFPYIFQLPITSLRRICVLPHKNGAMIPVKAIMVKIDHAARPPATHAPIIPICYKYIKTNYF